MKIISVNKKASFNYFLEKKIIAGLVLLGSEVKSIRKNGIQISQAYITFKDNEAFIINSNIALNNETNTFTEKNPTRSRKLLLNKKEIIYLKLQSQKFAYTIVPTKCFFNSNGHIKIEIALAKGKKLYDKRENIKNKEQKRKMELTFKKNIQNNH